MEIVKRDDWYVLRCFSIGSPSFHQILLAAAVLPSLEDQVEDQTCLVAYTAESLDQVGKDHVLEQDSLDPFLAYPGTAKPVASEGCYLVDEVAAVVDVVIAECEASAEIHEGHIQRNVVGIAGVEKAATFGFVARTHNCCLDQDRLARVEAQMIYPIDLAARRSGVLLS